MTMLLSKFCIFIILCFPALCKADTLNLNRLTKLFKYARNAVFSVIRGYDIRRNKQPFTGIAHCNTNPARFYHLKVIFSISESRRILQDQSQAFEPEFSAPPPCCSRLRQFLYNGLLTLSHKYCQSCSNCPRISDFIFISSTIMSIPSI